MLRRQIIAAGVATLCLNGGAMAAQDSSQTGSPFKYTWIDGGLGDVDDGSAIFVEGSLAIDRNLALVGGLYSYDFDGADGYLIEVGGQMRFPIDRKTDAYGSVRLYHSKIDVDNVTVCAGSLCVTARGGEADDTSVILRGGVRHAIDSRVHLEGELSYIAGDLFDGDLGLRAGGRFYFDKQLSVAVGLTVDTEIDGLYVSLRYDLK